MEKKKREEFIDIAKGIAILCVIIGHTWKNAYPADKRLMVFIYSFHMPLFFILSGWCLKSTDVKISSVIVKKIKQLVVPYVVINFIRTMIMSPELFLKTEFWRSLFYAAGRDMQKGLDGKPVSQIGMTWFLMSLFMCQILYLCVKKISEEYEVSMWLLIICLAMMASQLRDYFWLPLGIQAGVYGMFFYHSGCVMKEKKIFEKDLKKLPVGSILIGLFVWLLDIKVGCVGVHQASYGGIISLAAPVCGTYFVVKLSQFIYVKGAKISRFLSWCGRFSLYIYAIHALDVIGLSVIKRMVLCVFGLPSKKGALLYCVIRIMVVVIGARVLTVVSEVWRMRRMHRAG